MQVVAYECDGMLAFKHEEIEADSIKDAYNVFVDKPEGFRNWYIISLENICIR